MTPSQNHVLFTAADAVYTFVRSQKEFEHHLLTNLLFEEKLIMHDSYIANSRFLAEHIRGNPRGQSLFEVAAVNGLVVPAYRQHGTTTFRDALKIMKEVYGEKVYLHMLTEDQLTNDRLCECIDAGRQLFYWPNERLTMGEAYQNLLFDKLRNENSVRNAIQFTNQSTHEILWEKSADWRTILLDEAASATLKKGQSGIQRAEIYRLITENLGVNDVYNLAETHPRYDTAQAFLRWINHCHQLNIARYFGAAPHLINYNFTEDFVAAEFFSKTTSASGDGVEPLREEVLFPKWELLMNRIQEKPEHFIYLRNTYGADYRRSLQYWRQNPTWRNREELLISFKKYCAELCKHYLKSGESNWIIVMLMNGLNLFNPFIPGVGAQVSANIATKILGNMFKITSLTKTNIHIYHPLNQLDSGTK